MKLIKLSFVLILEFCFLYIYFTYTGFYYRIGTMNLKSPYTDKSLILVNSGSTTSAKYVALGDSLSSGLGSTDTNETFVYHYALKLSEKYENVNLINLANPGDTTEEVINNQVPQTIAEKPDYVTLLIGVNDIHNKSTIEDFRESYWYILNELLTKTSAHITVINIPYLGSDKIIFFPYNIFLNSRTRQFNEVISNVVTSANSAKRIRFVDLYKDTYTISKTDPKYYSPDLFHPSGEGYLLWSQIINAY
jgi:lysophospholipase L1-like esterase